MAETIRAREGGKRGRVLRTESGREVSHEEVIVGLVKKTAIEMANTDRVCACGSPLEKPKT